MFRIQETIYLISTYMMQISGYELGEYSICILGDKASLLVELFPWSDNFMIFGLVIQH